MGDQLCSPEYLEEGDRKITHPVLDEEFENRFLNCFVIE
jgi:hypothetical protein